MIKFLLYIFLFYSLYRLVFNFIIPVYKASRKVKNQFGEMQNRMQDFMEQQRKAQQPETTAPKEKQNKKPDDYIDFEEVK